MAHNHSTLTAVVLAGSRTANDPVAQAAGVSCKALTPVGNTAMVIRVLDALQDATTISTSILCGPSWPLLEQELTVCSRIESQHIQWVPPQSTPCTSTTFAMQSISEEIPVLVTTADHALLTSEIVDTFAPARLP